MPTYHIKNQSITSKEVGLEFSSRGDVYLTVEGYAVFTLTPDGFGVLTHAISRTTGLQLDSNGAVSLTQV